jgi:4-oxalocrotonate tautomerase
MPFVRIDLIAGRSDREIAAIGAAVQRALVECLGVPERDRFQVITEHAPGRLVYDRSYLEVPRTDGILFIQVLLSAGRTTDQKKAFYARLAELLPDAAAVRPEDVAIALVENTREDWSFGNGVAQYLVLAREQWK